MKPRNLFDTDERAVSPVIGVILMVAITVILAAVIGTFVLGLGDSLGDSQPAAQLNLDTTSSDITLEHRGGDAIPSEAVEIRVTNSSTGTSISYTATDQFSSRFAVGETASLGYTAGTGNDTTVRIQVIHTSSDSILFDEEVEIADLESVDSTNGWSVS